MNVIITLGDHMLYFPSIKPESVEDLAHGFVLDKDGVPIGPVTDSTTAGLGLISIRPILELDASVKPLYTALKSELDRQKRTQMHDLAFSLGALRGPGTEQ